MESVEWWSSGVGGVVGGGGCSEWWCSEMEGVE